MGYSLCRKPSGIVRASKLIEVSGNAFQLRHIIQMFRTHPFTHSPVPDKLPYDLGRPAARCVG